MDKKKALFPLFILKLVLINTAFFTSIVFTPIHRIKLLFYSSLLFILYIIMLGKHIFPKKQIKNDFIKLIHVKSNQDQLMTFKDFSKLSIFKQELESLNTITPNNRNILLNLSLINFYQGEVKSHIDLWDKARLTDPNHPLFKLD